MVSQNRNKFRGDETLYCNIKVSKVGDINRGVEKGANLFTGLLQFALDLLLIVLSV